MIKNTKQLPFLLILFFLSISLGLPAHADLQTELLTPRDHDTDLPVISPDGNLIIYRAIPIWPRPSSAVRHLTRGWRSGQINGQPQRG